MSEFLKITLVRGLSGHTEHQRKVVKGLGLTKVNRAVVRQNTPEIRGMVEKVKFLLHVEETGDAK
ncbi:MAG TPA: 50S ribosomal protein L30 [Candidatus Deferrimicrobiaceae bacterium]|jgi:large subunit ribosomal protein L30